MQSGPYIKESFFFFLHGGNNAKVHQCGAELYSHQNTHTSYYLGHFISATGGQKAIRLTAVKSKSFEATQNFNIRSIYSSLMSWVVELSLLIRRVNQTSFRLLHIYPLLFTKIPKLSQPLMLISISMSMTDRPSNNTNMFHI